MVSKVYRKICGVHYFLFFHSLRYKYLCNKHIYYVNSSVHVGADIIMSKCGLQHNLYISHICTYWEIIDNSWWSVPLRALHKAYVLIIIIIIILMVCFIITSKLSLIIQPLILNIIHTSLFFIFAFFLYHQSEISRN